MNESSEMHVEGNPEIEQAEQKALGTTTYEKVEVVHEYANTHPWFHPTLAIGGAVVIVCVIQVIFFILKR